MVQGIGSFGHKVLRHRRSQVKAITHTAANLSLLFSESLLPQSLVLLRALSEIYPIHRDCTWLSSGSLDLLRVRDQLYSVLDEKQVAVQQDRLLLVVALVRCVTRGTAGWQCLLRPITLIPLTQLLNQA